VKKVRFKFGDLTVGSDSEPWKSEGIRIGFYSAPGTRKSYTVAACIVEPFLEEKGTVVIFQPRSEWHTLKERWGKVVVVGGPFKDMPIAIKQARVYAEAIVKNGVSMVFDFSDTEERDLVRFAAEPLARIFTLQNVVRRPLLLVIEEAADYCPFRTTGKLVEPWVYDRMKGRIVKIATQGRPLGFMIVIISQRPAQLDYTVRMMCNLSFYGKFHPKDLNDIKQVLSAYDVQATQMAKKCVGMPHGSWIAITSEGGRYLTIDTERLTPHGADTPKLEYVAPRPETTEKVVSNLVKTIKEALERERREKSEVEKLRRELKSAMERYGKLEEEYEKLRLQAETLGKIKIELPKKREIDVTYIDKVRTDVVKELREKVLAVFDVFIPERKIITQFPKASGRNIYDIWGPKLPTLCAKRILKFLTENPNMKYTKSQIALKLGYSPRSGTFAGAIATLRRNKLIESNGKLFWFSVWRDW